MKRKPRRRPQPRSEQRTAPIRRPPNPPAPAPPAPPTQSPARPRASTAATRMCGLIAVLLVTGLLGIYLWMRLRAGPAGWPSRYDVGLPAWCEIVLATLLALSSLILILGQRSARSGRRTAPRMWLAIAVLLAMAAVGCRAITYHQLVALGMVPWRVNESAFDSADLYYVHAVHTGLQQHFRQLDQKRIDRPDLFSDDDQQRLELIERLQTCMVSWTEGEVGHWLDDLQRRRSVMAIMAYQIHPLVRDQQTIKDAVYAERQYLSRARERFEVMREYCRQKTALIESLPPSQRPSSLVAADAGAAGGSMPGASSPAPVAGGESGQAGTAAEPAAPDAFARLNDTLRSQLRELGAEDWAYARAVLDDAIDLAMTGERVTQIETRLSDIDARANYLSDNVDPILARPEAGGLNAQHAWLQLPVQFPNARCWLAAFAPLASIHTVALVFLSLILMAMVLVGVQRAGNAVWNRIGVLWHAVVVAGVTLSLLFCFA